MALVVSRATLADLPEVVALMKPAWRALLDAEWPEGWNAPKEQTLRDLIAANDVRTVVIVRDTTKANAVVMAAPIYHRGDKYEFGLRLWDTTLSPLQHTRAIRALLKSVCQYVSTHAGADVPLYGIVRTGSPTDTFFSGFAWLTRKVLPGDGTQVMFTANASVAGAGF